MSEVIPDDTQVYRQRLLNVAKALRESAKPDEFSMADFGTSCGTPMCALGHYAARRDLQDHYLLTETGDLKLVDGGVDCTKDDAKHFGITYQEASELFFTEGCGGATSIQQAIDYIEAFVSRKWPVAS